MFNNHTLPTKKIEKNNEMSPQPIKKGQSVCLGSVQISDDAFLVAQKVTKQTGTF